MVRKKQAGSDKLLTEVELELMTILWKLKEGSVSEVMEGLPPQRKLAYTSVSTMLRILEQKGIVGSRKEGRCHAYFPLLSKEDYEAASLKHLVNRVFDGTPASLVQRLLDTDGLTQEELKSIRSVLDKKLS